MKKIVLILLMSIGVFSAMGQTNFRHITYKEALEAAKAENKLVFLDFYTVWCGPCKNMLANIFPLKNVGDYFNEKFVSVKIDAEKGEGPQLTKLYKVIAYPTFVVIDADEKVVTTILGGAPDGDKFIALVDRRIDPERRPERLQERYDSGERTANLISLFSGLKMEQAFQNPRPDMKKKEEAYKMVQDYFDGLNDAQKLLSENLFMYTSFTEKPTDAIARYMIENRDKFAADVQEQVAGRIAYLYNMEVRKYLMGVPFDEQQLATLKGEIVELGLNKDDVYTACLQLLESYATGDLNAFLKFCERKYKDLNDDQKTSLMYNFSGFMEKADMPAKKRAVKFIRGLLSNMNASLLGSAGQQLIAMEREIKK